MNLIKNIYNVGLYITLVRQKGLKKIFRGNSTGD